MDDDIDYDEELILEYMVDQRKALPLFPTGTIVKSSYYRKALTHREKGFNLRRNWIRILLYEVLW